MHLTSLRFVRRLIPTPTFENIKVPETFKLPYVPKIPLLSAAEKSQKSFRNLKEMRGPEEVENKLIHKQYGIIATSGGHLRHSHFELMCKVVNRWIQRKKVFAIWRVPAPWKPCTKKPIGFTMGGGKGNVKFYITPIKSGRVILEVGGRVEYVMIKSWLTQICKCLPFKARPISQEIMEKEKEKEELLKGQNINPYSMEFIIKNRMQGCYNYLSPYDFKWFDKYR